MKISKFIRTTIGANFLLVFVFAFLPVLAIKPDAEVLQSLLEYINKE